MGVPYDLFWHLSPVKLKPFFEAYRQKRQEKSNDMWLMGQYVMAALDATVCNCMPFMKRSRKGEYPDEPIRVIPKTQEEIEADEMRELQKFLGFTGDLEKDVKRRTKGE